jgi:predicted PurR-regulated permease PerM
MTIEKRFFLLVTALVLFLFWKVLEPIILVIIVAAVVTVILSPVDKHLKKILTRPRLSAALLSLATFFLIFIPILTVLFLMATQASDLIRNATSDTSWIEELKLAAAPMIDTLPAPAQAEIAAFDLPEIGKSVATWAFQNVGNVFSSSTQLVLNTFIFFLCLYYLLVNREHLYNEALALSPLANETDKMLLKRIVNTIRGVVFGVLLVAIIQGVIAGIGMTIFGVPGALIWGALTVIAGLVPLLGTALVLIPAILYLLFTGSTTAAIGLLIWAAVFVGLIDNLVGPSLIGGRAHLHSFLVLISVLGGLAAFGSVGVIAGPAILASLLGLIQLYKSGILSEGRIRP